MLSISPTYERMSASAGPQSPKGMAPHFHADGHHSPRAETRRLWALRDRDRRRSSSLGSGVRSLVIAVTRVPETGPGSRPEVGNTPASVSPREARAAVAEAVEARQARPPLTISRGLAVTHALGTETSCGLVLALLGGGAAAAVFFGVGGVVGWLAGAVAGIVFLVGPVAAWATVPHHIRAPRHHRRVARISRRLAKASERSQPESGDIDRVSAFRSAIVEGSIHPAALGLFMLYRELADDEALADDIRQTRSPVGRPGRTTSPFPGRRTGRQSSPETSSSRHSLPRIRCGRQRRRAESSTASTRPRMQSAWQP